MHTRSDFGRALFTHWTQNLKIRQFSDQVCHACGTFIASNLKREKDNSAVMEVDDHSGRFKRLLPTTISSPDRSPQARKGKKATGQKSSAKKSLSFKDISNSVVNTDSDHNKLSTLNTADDSRQEAGELFLISRHGRLA